MLLERLDELKSIMTDNGTYIHLPPVGSQASLVSVFGDHRVNIQRTCRAVMQLVSLFQIVSAHGNSFAQACQFYVASFWLLPVHFNVLMPVATLNPASMPGVLKRIAGQSGSEVVFKSNCFEMHGLEHEVRSAVMMVLELDVIQASVTLVADLAASNQGNASLDLPSRDSVPDRACQRTSRFYKREKERKDQQNYADGQCQDQV